MTCALVPGCSTGDGLLPTFDSIRQVDGATAGSVRADWDDIDAALDVGLFAAESAILSDNRPGRGQACFEMTFQLRTVGGETGSITFSREAAGGPDPRGPELITVKASVGLYRDRAREKKLVAATIRRLEALAGVDWAPIPGSPYAN